jgi:O-antigen chain-terminating methyltransferase
MNDEVQQIDVERVMHRIRENIRRRTSAGDVPAPEPDPSPFADGQGAADLAYLHSGYDITDVSLVSHRRIFGPLVLAAKKVFRKLLAPVLARQVAYNAASTRVTTQLKDWIEAQEQAQGQINDALRERDDALRERDDALRENIVALAARLRAERAELRAELRAVESRAGQALGQALSRQADLAEEQSRALQALKQASVAERERVSRAERTLRRVLHASQTPQSQVHGPESPARARASVAPEVPARLGEFDYAGFEERFRGSEQEIKERQEIYVSYFEGRNDVVDIGCGRGEFLELMRERGIRAHGVDLDLDMILLCREKGLDVSADDAFAYLAALPDDSLGGIFAAQVIEHLHPVRIIELVDLCHRKLGPGGVLILETPNPKCLMVFADTFYKDPSHVQPAHPDTMQFLFEALNFHQIELRFLGAVDPLMRIPSLQLPGADLRRFNEGIDRLNSLLFGFQEYAVIGRKSLARPHEALPSPERES